jgi:DNA polymerase elongation subunit (family B)
VPYIREQLDKRGVNVLNHCIVLGGCDPIPNVEVECYKEEREVLVAWTRLIQREDPDILIGYNIFGFDEQFMFKRALETGCIDDFVELTRNKHVMAGKQVEGEWAMEEKSVFLASGEYNLNYFKQAMDELKNLVIQSLETNGVLGQVRAQLRSCVFKAIDN